MSFAASAVCPHGGVIRMEVDLFAGVAVSDFDRAVAWFERLLGEPTARIYEASTGTAGSVILPS
jgi:hypothetical protein